MASQIYPSQSTYFMQIGDPAGYYPYSTSLTPTMSSSSSSYLPGIYSSSRSKTPSGLTGTSPVPAPTKQIHRNRASYSCHCCRRRKVKCDQVHPTCGNCKKHGDECTYNDNSNVKSKKKDGVKKNAASSSSGSVSMSGSRSKQSKYDDGRLLASPIYSEFPSVTPVASSSYGSPSSSTYLTPAPVSSGYHSPQAYSPSYYSDYASPPASSNAYYDYGYSTSTYTSSIPAAVDPIMSYAPSSYDDPTYGAYTTSESSYGYYQTSG